tara:strand:+ start:217 stop:1269 length:1053 start_codon:yes stop_codon:yes gene_type:complete
MITDVFTDGACIGNPGPGGWAFVVDQGQWASGAEGKTTNQRMELTAASAAVQSIDGPIRVHSDSTYVVNCFNQNWWKGWHKRGWKNSKNDPVANRDLWEPFIELVIARGDVEFIWVKGHSGDRLNDAADRLATLAAAEQEGRTGGHYADSIVRGLSDDDVSGKETPGAKPRISADNKNFKETLTTHGVAIFGHRPPDIGGYGETSTSLGIRRKLITILRAKAEMETKLEIVTGLSLGVEMLGAEAAAASGLPYVVILAFDGVDEKWPDSTRARFRELLDGARQIILVSNETPVTATEYAKVMGRRDDRIIARSKEAIIVRNAEDKTMKELHGKLDRTFDDGVWAIEPTFK